MINDELVSTDTKTPDGGVNPRSPPSNDNDDEFEDDCILDEDGNELPITTEDLDQQELNLEELTEIDELYGRIETDIEALATREQKEVSDIEAMLEAAAEQYET